LSTAILSGITRTELVRHGFAIMGRPPATVLPDMTDDDVRRAGARGALQVLGMGLAPTADVAEPADR